MSDLNVDTTGDEQWDRFLDKLMGKPEPREESIYTRYLAAVDFGSDTISIFSHRRNIEYIHQIVTIPINSWENPYCGNFNIPPDAFVSNRS